MMIKHVTIDLQDISLENLEMINNFIKKVTGGGESTETEQPKDATPYKKHRATNLYKPWSPEDDAYMMGNMHLTARYLARRLGRTVDSINTRKTILRGRLEPKENNIFPQTAENMGFHSHQIGL